jgi:hypothetical protein
MHFMAGRTKRDQVVHYIVAEPVPVGKVMHSYEVQTQMVRELEGNATPCIVLDSEFEPVHEPNNGSKHTGDNIP